MASSSGSSRRRGMAAPEHGRRKKPRLLTFSESDDEIERRRDNVEDGGDDEEIHGESGDHNDGVEDEEEESSGVHWGLEDEEEDAPPAYGDDDGAEDEEEESSGVHGESEEEEEEEAPPARAAVEDMVAVMVDGDALECGVCFRPLRPPIYQCEVGHVVCSPCRDKLAPARAAVEDMMAVMVDGDALECGVCFRPLRPPIYQCEVGHVVCSPCSDKLAPAGRCHVCGVAVGSYRRCHGMEQLLDSIRVACQHAAHGCAARPAYYDLDAHRAACRHAPCHCPGDACSFVASTAALLDHFAAAHNWPCTTKVRSGETSSVRLHDGFNFLQVDHRGGASSGQYLVMLNMAREPHGRVISVLCIHPHFAADRERGSSAMLCELMLFRHHGNVGEGPDLCRSHYQKSEFRVGYSDLSDGLPDPKLRFQVVLPRGVLRGEDGANGGIRIDICITIN